MWTLAIVGLGNTIITMDECEKPKYIPARIMAYITARILTIYPYDTLEQCTLKDSSDCYANFIVDPIGEEIEILDLATGLESLSEKDIHLISERFFIEKKYWEIGNELGITADLACKKIQNILRKLRKDLE